MKTTIIFAYILYYTFTFFLIYLLFIGLPIWDGFFYWLWKILQNNDVKYGYLIFVFLETFFTLLPIMFYKRRYLNNDKKICHDNIALIIPCHKAEKIIKYTLENALKVFDSKNIYVIDNGNSNIPYDNTSQICKELDINYVWVPIGGKLPAIYTGIKLINKYEFVMQIDDDVFLNDTMVFPIDEKIQCIAYIISASNHNGDKKIIHHLQDMEYKYSGFMKGVQSFLGSTMFAHGAISLWRRTTLLEVLENHSMYSMSEDWFIGFKANKLGYKIDVCDNTFIDTDTPSSFFTTSRTGGYGNASLFSQRFYRWYMTYLVQLFYMLYYCIFCWNLPIKILLIQKVFFLWEIFSSLSFLKIYIFIFYIIYELNFTLIMYSIYIILNLFGFVIFNYYQLQCNERLPFWIIFIYPIYSIYDSCVFCLAVFYSILINPTILFHRSEKLYNNQKLKNVIDSNINKFN